VSASDPEVEGKAGAYFSVLNAASLKGFSLLTCARLWLRTAEFDEQLRDGLGRHAGAAVGVQTAARAVDLCGLFDEVLGESASSRAATVQPTA
jgi:hypothetical protein